jgi:hypothetical protein
MLTTACTFQTIVPGTVLVGGCAAIYYAGHRMSFDADLWKDDLYLVFNETADQLVSSNHWKTKWLHDPTSILGFIDGIKASVWQLSRPEPLETVTVQHNGMKLVIATEEETIRIKSMAVILRGSTRDYIDLAALFENAGPRKN